jgi:hypothetical protein
MNETTSASFPKVLVMAIGLALACCAPALAQTAPRADAVFTVGRYPVEAEADNAVAAKEKALAEGYQGAFQSLLRRVVPVTSYGALKSLKRVNAADLVEGMAVRSERNSPTTYIAALDFSFSAKAVRDLLRREGIPYIEAQAPPTAVAPIYVAPAGSSGALAAAQGARTWSDVWKSLDIEQTLTPLKIVAPPAVSPEGLKALANDPGAASKAVPNQRDGVVVAILEPDLGARRLNLRMAGTDAAGPFVLQRAFRFEQADLAYGSELAAVVLLGILEGRWKAVRVAAVPGGAATLAAPLQPVQLLVEFRSMAEWQSVSRRISELPGVEDYDVAGLSTRGANVALRFPGGAVELKRALALEGMELENAGGAWIARAR